MTNENQVTLRQIALVRRRRDGAACRSDIRAGAVARGTAGGQYLLVRGRLHGGERRNARGAGIFAWYTRPIYRTQENWFLALDPSVRQFASDMMLELLGYRTAGLGLVNGASPA